MAKKRKKKKTSKKKKLTPLSFEIIGIVTTVLAIVGVANLGLAGRFLQGFAKMLVGVWYSIFFLVAIYIGIYLIIKRAEYPWKNNKFLGFGLLISSVLVYSHTKYIKEAGIDGLLIIDETWSNWVQTLNDPMSAEIKGGGLIGAFLSYVFAQLFDIQGALIVAFIAGIIGFSLMTEKSMIEWIRVAFRKLKEHGAKISEERRRKIEEAEREFEEEDNKIIISSIEEVNEIKKESSKEKEVKEIPTSNLTEQSFELNVSQTPVIDKETGNNTTIRKGDYQLPKMYYLKAPKISRGKNKNSAIVKSNVGKLEQVLKDFNVGGRVVAVNIGPAVTQFELRLDPGTKVSKIENLSKEISLSLAARDVRIQAPIPGKNTIGIEIPNYETRLVTLREVLEKSPVDKKENKLLIGLGCDIMGRPIHTELNKMPHLLVAGATGSGKSVCINSLIISILMRAKPDEVKFIMVDPKKVELNVYNGIPHLLAPVVTDPRRAAVALKRVVEEMERRYDLFSDSGTRNIAGYNAYIEAKNENLGDSEKQNKLPFIVVVIDELADLMVVASKEVEDSIMRITQMARAAGIHLIVATQRPSTDVITGIIKANIPSRIAFAVSSSIDSRTIIDSSGAEKLLGNGDMLFVPIGENSPIRIQGAYLSDEEVERIVNHTVKQQKSQFDEKLLNLEVTETKSNNDTNLDDPLYDEVVKFVIETQKASASLIQRRFRVGYNRAARLVDILEEKGIIGPRNGSKPREVLMKLEEKE